MGPGVALLIAELVRIGLAHIEAQGKYNTLTEDEAKATAAKIGASLADALPTPEDLEKPPQD